MGDIEWIAFEVFQDDESDADDDDESESDTDTANDLLPSISALKLDSSPITSSPPLPTGILAVEHQHSSLSLLEYVLRLAALQTFEQQSHMNLTDEHIVLFLRDDNPASHQQPTIEHKRALRRQSTVRRQSLLIASARGRTHPNLAQHGRRVLGRLRSGVPESESWRPHRRTVVARRQSADDSRRERCRPR